MKEMITEESVVSKVQELMETLDQIKRYNALAQSLKVFALIIIGSITLTAALGTLFDFSSLGPVFERTQYPQFLLVLPVINLSGLIVGVLYVKRRVDAVRMGEWKEELAHGFPAALKMLLELDWDKTLDEISVGKLSYALYILLKTVAYWVVTFFGLSLLGNAVIFFVLQRAEFLGGFFPGVLALLIVLLILGNDLLRRYKEIHALDMLLLELRWFSFEFRRAEFET